jgi:hypothetical protein
MILVERGDCTFVTKTRHIAKEGGQVAVIIDNKESENVKTVVMSDDGSGAGLEIPALLISYRDGQILKEFLKHSDPNLVSEVSLTAQFEMNHPSDSVDVNFWYTSNDDRSLIFVKDMADFIIPLSKSDKGINLKPKFVHWSCPHCDSDFKNKHCLSDGKYCAMNHEQSAANYLQQGKEIVMENLRMYCVFQSQFTI